MFAAYHTAVAYWPLAVVLALIGLAFVFPAVSLPIARWVLGTETGRALLAVVIVVAAFLWYREARFSAGYSAAVAVQAAKANRAALDVERKARVTEQLHAKALTAVAESYERDKADAIAQRDGVIAGLRAGTVRLRDHWTCPVAVPGIAAGAVEPAAAADLRATGAADLIAAGDEADAIIRALQAVTQADRK